MTTILPFSPSEQSYTSIPLASTSSSSSSLLRTDARLPFSYRDISLSLNVSDNTVGSAKVVIGEKTEVWAGVRAEVEDWREGGPRVVVGIESLPSSPTTPVPTPTYLAHLSSLLTSLFSPPSLPTSILTSLSILPQSKTWVLYLDILIVSSLGGNIIDSAIIASRSALASVVLPRVVAVTVEGDDDGMMEGEEGGVLGLGEEEKGISGFLKGGKAGRDARDFELVDPSAGIEQGVRLDGWQDLPVGITLNLINQQPHLDSTLLEESAASSSLTFCFSSNGNLCGVTQIGEGEVELGRVKVYLKEAKKCAGDLILALNERLKDV